MSKDRQRKQKLMVDGYSRDKCKECGLDMPSDIVSIIFLFYFIERFDIEYGKRVTVKKNIIKSNCSDFNTTVIGDWMDPAADDKQHHKITLKVIKRGGVMIIGIVEDGYDLDGVFTNSSGYSFMAGSSGYRYLKETPEWEPVADNYENQDVVTLTLNFKSLSLAYDIIKSTENAPQSGILYKAEEIRNTRYKWAVAIFQMSDSIEILDISCS